MFRSVASPGRWFVIPGVRGLSVACLLVAGPLHAEEPLDLYYNERPPYLVSALDGSVSGLTATPAAESFREAGIAFQWMRLPSNRQLALLKDNHRPACAVGWFRNAEREHFAKFSKPIYQDKPTVGMASDSFAATDKLSLSDLLNRRDIKVLVKDGYSYGPYIDNLLAAHRANQVVTSADNIDMARMISGRRADFMFVAEEEASSLLQQAGLNPLYFKVLRFADMPMGEYRYIMCDKLVPDEVIQRLNTAIHPR